MPKLLHVVVGPRQVGKTTAAQAVIANWQGPTRYAAADLPAPPGPEWIEFHWQLGRKDADKGDALLVLDEVQKVRGWSQTIKYLWDQDRMSKTPLRVLLLGSSALLLSLGTVESLAGRFFLHRCVHWSYPECRDAFGWGLDTWLFFGGYPGCAEFITHETMWKNYVRDSLIETVLARDVLAMQTVAKPALLRNLFILAAQYPAQIVAYNKLMGQLHDAGNTTTLAHYLKLLESAFLVSGLKRFAKGFARKRASIPKLLLWNNALINALHTRTFSEVRSNPAFWGRLVENAVGAHLINSLQSLPYEVMYWRERNDEVDFVVQSGRNLWALEVKSGQFSKISGLEAFKKRWQEAKPMVIGSGGMPLAEFFNTHPAELFR